MKYNLLAICLMCALLPVSLTADMKYKNSGSLDYTLTHIDGTHINTVDLILNNDFYFENTKISISPGIFTNDHGTYNSVIKGDVSKINEVYLNEAYISQKITDNLSVAIGVFPFRKGSFYEYGFNGYRAGNGIYSITDIVLQGAIISYVYDKHTIQFGTLKYEQFIKSFKDFERGDGSVNYDSFKNSSMDYLAYKNSNGPWYTELQFSKISQFINDVDIIDSNVYTVGFSHDTSQYNGNTLYAILSYSTSKGDTSSLLPTAGMYSGAPPIPPNSGDRYSDDSYHYDNFDSAGYYYLLGIKQEFDKCLFDRDIVLSVEYAYRSPGYHNLLAGRPLSPHSYADIGYFYNLSVGIRVDKNNMVKLRYLLYDTNNQSTKYGFSPVATSSSNIPGSKDRYQSLILQWYLDF